MSIFASIGSFITTVFTGSSGRARADMDAVNKGALELTEQFKQRMLRVEEKADACERERADLMVSFARIEMKLEIIEEKEKANAETNRQLKKAVISLFEIAENEELTPERIAAIKQTIDFL